MRKSALLNIFLVVFIDLLGFGIVIPILPYYAKFFGASGWALGWLMTSYSLMQFLIAPLWGSLSDKIGRRPVLLVSILGTCLSMTFLGFAQSLVWLFAGRIFAGICGANISTAYAYITDVTDESNRAKGMGVIGAAFGLGFIFGPAVGGVLSRHGYSVPMFVGAGLAAFNFVFALLTLGEPPLTREARAANRARRFDRETLRMVFSDPRSKLAITEFFLFTLAWTQIEVVFALYMNARYGYDARDAGVLLACMGIVMVLVQGGMIGRLVKKYGEISLVLTGLVLCACGLTAFGMAREIGWAIALLAPTALGQGILHPSLSSLASKGAKANSRGLTMGVFQSAGSLARVIGPVIAGWLFDQAGWSTPFYAASVILGLGFALMAASRKSVAVVRGATA
jgi:DHA1 family tetracycline resistance protein-like MFS transporter